MNSSVHEHVHCPKILWGGWGRGGGVVWIYAVEQVFSFFSVVNYLCSFIYIYLCHVKV